MEGPPNLERLKNLIGRIKKFVLEIQHSQALLTIWKINIQTALTPKKL